ncbi:NADP-dependent oxidoreductase [Bradyrhizobium lablabi]|uniref:NADP-dependent oxidoreductase n=1 Tax=Bradyrhizobium lablabi TaxID=722472 RepID=UPI001BA67B1E|nr:NADP-dependent oxidoreductase [Bradyrhizobium lablabi]MBR0696118.1 NADP-dependent oxidoreductase [Bradyrhizobium lablabi]
MRAMTYRQYGGPEVLELQTLPMPKVGQNSVLVRICAAALNPADLALQAGHGEPIMDAWFPVIPGWDMAGVVEAVGDGVGEFSPGDKVLAYVRQEVLHYGSYAEFIAVPVDVLVRKPPFLSWAQAAALPLAGLTAHRAVATALDIGPGDTALVHGASGGVGVLAAQLARLRGATVFGTASPGKHAFLASLGITPVAYGPDLADELLRLMPDGFDVALDCAGKGALSTAAGAMKPDARVASIAAFGEDVPMVYARQDIRVLEELAGLCGKHALHVPIAAAFPLEEAAEAQRLLANGAHGSGKIVLEM